MYATQAQTATEWLIVAELIFLAIAAGARRRHRQGGDARPLPLWATALVGIADFAAVIFAILIAGKATIGFGTFAGLIIVIVTGALAGIALAQTIASRRGLEISMKDALTAPRRHPLPSLLGAVAGTLVGGLPGGSIMGAIFGASLSHGQRVRKAKMTTDQLVSPLAAILGIPESDLTDGKIKWGYTKTGQIIIPRPSARILTHLDQIPARLATHLPDLCVETANATEIVFSPVDDETQARRERAAQLAEQHEGLVVDIRPNESTTPTTEAGNGIDLDLSDEEF